MEATLPSQSSSPTAELARLNVALAQSYELRAEQKAELALLKGEPPPCCRFLEKIPIEVRNEIYKILLVNDILATGLSLYKQDGFPLIRSALGSLYRNDLEYRGFEIIGVDFPAIQKYNLTPAILRTCRQIYKESSSILYGCNTFFAICLGGRFLSPVVRRVYESRGDSRALREDATSIQHTALSNLSLRQDESRRACTPTTVPDYTAINHVRRWKVWTIDPRAKHRQPHAWLSFCRAISGHRLQSLTVLVANGDIFPWSDNFESSSEDNIKNENVSYTPFEADDPRFKNLRKPLGMVRSNSFYARASTVDDVSQSFANSDSMLSSHYFYDLQVTIEGYMPVEYPFKMLRALSHYAQAFERNEHFKSRTDIRVGSSAAWPHFLISDHRDFHESVRFDPFVSVDFEEKTYHPVEHGLALAGYASDVNDCQGFKVSRRRVC